MTIIEVPSSEADVKNLSETNSCFLASRNVVQKEPSLASENKQSKDKTRSKELHKCKVLFLSNVKFYF